MDNPYICPECESLNNFTIDLNDFIAQDFCRDCQKQWSRDLSNHFFVRDLSYLDGGLFFSGGETYLMNSQIAGNYIRAGIVTKYTVIRLRDNTTVLLDQHCRVIRLSLKELNLV